MSFHPPPDKRRKVDPQAKEKISDDCWEDEDFTDEQLENIDELVMQSQSIPASHINIDSNHNKQTLAGGSKTVGKGTQKSHSSGQIYNSGDMQQFQNTNKWGGQLTPYNKMNENKFQYSKGQNSSTNSVVKAQSKEKDDLKKQLEQYKSQLEKQTELQRSNNGQIKVLRAKLDAQQAERLEKQQQLSRERVECEKKLISEKDSLQVQLNFKEQEINELKRNCKSLEQKAQLNTASPKLPVPRSPKAPDAFSCRSPVTTKGGAFLNEKAFVAEVSGCIPGNNEKSLAKISKPSEVIDQSTAKQGPPQKKFFLNNKSKDMVAVKVLDDVLFDDMPSLEECGMLYLLNVKPIPKEVSKFKVATSDQTLSQSRTNKFLHMIKGHMARGKLQVPPIVTQEIYSLALKGISLMSDASTTTRPTNNSKWKEWSGKDLAILLLPLLEQYLSAYLFLRQKSIRMSGVSPSTCVASSSSASAISSIDTLTSSIRTLMLKGSNVPDLFNGYAFCSLRVLHKLVCWSPSVSNALLSNKYSTDEQQDLPKVVPTEKTDSQIGDKIDVAEPQKNETGAKKPSSAPSTSIAVDNAEQKTANKRVLRCEKEVLSKGYVHKLMSRVTQRCHITRHLIKMATQFNDIEHAPLAILSLKILASLLTSCKTQEHFDRFLPIIHLDIIINTLNEHNKLPKPEYYHVIELSLDMLIAMSVNKILLKALCQSNGNCTLLAVYNLHHILQGYDDLELKSQITDKFITLLSRIANHYKNGIRLLLATSCKCSLEIVKSVISVLHEEVLRWRRSEKQFHSVILRKGASLLRCMSAQDKLYQKHRERLEYQYRELLCGLDVAIRDSTQSPHLERELAALHGRSVWDFEQKYPPS